MENLSIQDSAGPGPPRPMNAGAPPAAPPPQLPPQMFTTAASLLDLTDKKLIVILRDGRKIIGVLRSWDQFGNLVLQDSIERIFITAEHLPRVYADVWQGIFLVRGENTMMMGEIDLDRDEYVPEPYTLADVEQVRALRRQETELRKSREKREMTRLKSLGFEGEKSGEAVL